LKKLISLLVLIVLTACNNHHEESYQAILIHGSQRYLLSGTEEAEVNLARKIGVVERTVKPHIMPEYNLWSNYLEKGTEIYASSDTDTIIYAKTKDGKIQKFEQEKIEYTK
jgi:hypothetical protein